MLKRLRNGVLAVLSNWLYTGVGAVASFAFSLGYGWNVLVALRQGIGLHGTVTWYSKGEGNMMQYSTSNLLLISILWLCVGVILLAVTLYQQSRSKTIVPTGRRPKR